MLACPVDAVGSKEGYQFVEPGGEEVAFAHGMRIVIVFCHGLVSGVFEKLYHELIHPGMRGRHFY